MNAITALPEMSDLWQQTLNWQPDREQQQKFQKLYELIVEGNRNLNLTRITEPMEFWEKHLWDSLRGLGNSAHWPSGGRAIDIGTGAGFPGLPVAISLPQLSVTLLDSTRKKINFVDTILSELQLENASTVIGRAEEIGKQPPHRELYDIAFLRAVAPASDCAKYALPLLKNGGLGILYRGKWTPEEEEELQAIVKKLGGNIELIDALTTPLSQSVRHCIYLRKS